MSKDDILTEIRTLLAGRCAEELVFDTQTSGAANDIERATELARNLVARFGMTEEFDMMALGTVHNQYLDGSARMDCSNETSAKVDAAVMRLLNEAYARAKQVLVENRALLDEIAEYLLVKETITGDELMAFVNADKQTAEEPAETEE